MNRWDDGCEYYNTQNVLRYLLNLLSLRSKPALLGSALCGSDSTNHISAFPAGSLLALGWEAQEGDSKAGGERKNLSLLSASRGALVPWRSF